MIERQAVRALLINPQHKLLLIKMIEPQTKQSFWLTPGGGINPGELPLAGLRREIFEETGLRDFEVGPEVWQREKVFTWAGQVILQRERFYLVQIEPFEPTTHYLPDPVEEAAFAGFRWWSVAEIEQSPEFFVPKQLGALLGSLIEGRLPEPPLFLTD